MKSKTKILVFGTFDIIHKGHLNFFKQARKISKNPLLIVSVARGINVKKIKGNFPEKSEKERMANLKKIRLIDKVVLGAKTNYILHIKNIRPDIIALGYDQKAYTKNLKKLLQLKGFSLVIHRLKPYLIEKYKTSLIKNGKI